MIDYVFPLPELFFPNSVEKKLWKFEFQQLNKTWRMQMIQTWLLNKVNAKKKKRKKQR